jgi:hypothetical protein
MKFCPVVPEICRRKVHGPRNERKRIRIIIRYGAKTISLSNIDIIKFSKWLPKFGIKNGR